MAVAGSEERGLCYQIWRSGLAVQRTQPRVCDGLTVAQAHLMTTFPYTSMERDRDSAPLQGIAIHHVNDQIPKDGTPIFLSDLPGWKTVLHGCSTLNERIGQYPDSIDRYLASTSFWASEGIHKAL